MIERKGTIYRLKNIKVALSLYFPIYKVVAYTLPQFTCRGPSFLDIRVEVTNPDFWTKNVLPKTHVL